MISFGSSFSKCYTAHPSNLLVTPCSALDATLWLLVVIYIAISSAKSDPSTPFPSDPNILLIATRKRVTLNSTPCGIPKSVYLLCEMVPPTLQLSPISSLMNSIDHSSLYSHVVQVSFLCWLCHTHFWYQRRLLPFYLFSMV